MKGENHIGNKKQNVPRWRTLITQDFIKKIVNSH